jgi:signal peptidase II
MQASRFRHFLLIVLALGVVGCDHATKIAAKSSLEHAPAVPVVLLRYTENDDVAFSVLRNLGLPKSPVILAIGAVCAIAIVASTLLRRRLSRLAQVGSALILAGALGNVVDRIARGYVIDFIHVRGWPVFNVADVAVVVGIGLVVIAHLVRARDSGAGQEVS